MVLCIVISPSWKASVVDVSQKRISALLGGQVTFVGGVPSLGGYVVAREEGEGDAWERGCPLFFPELERDVRGEVVLFASDEDGEEEDLDVASATSLLAAMSKKGVSDQGDAFRLPPQEGSLEGPLLSNVEGALAASHGEPLP